MRSPSWPRLVAPLPLVLLAACGNAGGSADDVGPDAGPVRGDPGEVDPGFGVDGTYQTTYAISTLAAAPDGGAVAGLSGALLHVEADGSIDPSIDPTRAIATFEQLIATGDGRFFALHDDYYDDTRSQILRLDADLALDPTFAAARLADFSPSGAAPTADGGVVVVGTRHGATDQVVIERFDATGAVVTTFGVGGVAVTDPALDVRGSGVVTLADGTSIVRGEDGFTPCLLRVSPTGALDTSFGPAGVLRIDALGPRYSRALAVDAAGGLLVLGMTNDAIQLARVTPDGALDPAFGERGVASVDVTRPLSSAYEEHVEAHGLLVDGAGRMVVTASYEDDEGWDGVIDDQAIVVARFTAGGALDAAFGDGGTTTVHLAASAAASRSYTSVVATLGDDRLLVGGEVLVDQAWRGGLTALWQ